MHLRSGLIVGDLGGIQTNHNQAIIVATPPGMQDDNFSNEAEAGTPYQSFSTNGGERSPGNSSSGEGGPSSSQHLPQLGQNHFRPLSQRTTGHQDFQLFPSPKTEPNDFNEEEIFEDQLSVPESSRRPTTNQVVSAPTGSEAQLPDSYFPQQNSSHTSTLPQVPPATPHLAPHDSTAGQVSPGMIPEWTARPEPWSPVAQAPSESRKRALVRENPTHDMKDYPKDRDFQDKMEEDLDMLGHGGPELSSEEDRRKRKRPRHSKRTRPSKTGGWARHEHEPREHEKDGESGQGGAQSMTML